MGDLDLSQLGPAPGVGDRFVLVTLHADGRLQARTNMTSSQAEVVVFLRSAAEDLAAGSAPGSGLVIPGALA